MSWQWTVILCVALICVFAFWITLLIVSANVKEPDANSDSN